jgi:hypothetical protein
VLRRVLLVWADQRISFLQQGVAVWSRSEALGGVRSAMFSELPPAATAAAAAAAATGAVAPDSSGQQWQQQMKQFFQLQLLTAKASEQCHTVCLLKAVCCLCLPDNPLTWVMKEKQVSLIPL